MAPSVEIALAQHPTAFDKNITESSLPTHIEDLTTTTHQPNSRVLNPVFVTQDFDALRFDAAAQNQILSPDSVLPRTSTDPSAPTYTTTLISSPYNNASHYLDITTLPPASRLLALALTALRPTRPDYATAPYTASLNLSAVLTQLRSLAARENFTWKETSFYVVVFRSQLNHGVDQDWLYKLDYESHREACEGGGLLKYWFGKADLEGERRNLATCFWHSREDAQRGGMGPWHAKARRAGRELYETIVFSTHRFTVLEGAEGYRFEDWEG